MSRNVVDERVVQMEFDNSNFEKNVKTSMGTIDKLQNTLVSKLGSSTSSKAFDMVGTAAGELGKNFSALEQIGIGVFRGLGNSISGWAAKAVSDLSGVGDIVSGWQKYDTITRASGTLFYQGYEMDEIESQLERLNWFTDETSYNLGDMVDNISKFTASGQTLEDSSQAMMGIALWASSAGQNAQTASRAMYQLSQAMGSGAMMKQDWMSVQNANMDTRQFRELALQTAVEMKTLEKTSDGLYKSLMANTDAFSVDQFANHLTQDAWFTSDVMMEVYSKYANAVDHIKERMNEKDILASDAVDELLDEGIIDEFEAQAFKAAQESRTWADTVDATKDAMSTGWMNVFKLLIGNYKEATDFFSNLSEHFYLLFVNPVNDLVEILEVFNSPEVNGSEQLRNGLLGVVEIITNIAGTAKEAFWSILLPGVDSSEERAEILANRLKAVVTAFSQFVNKLKSATTENTTLMRILQGVFSIFKLIFAVISGIFSGVTSLFSGVEGTISTVGEGVASIADKITAFVDKVTANNGVRDFFVSLFKPVKAAKDLIVGFATSAWNAISSFGTKIADKIAKLKGYESAEEMFGSIGETVGKVLEVVQNFFESISLGISNFGTLMSDIWTAIFGRTPTESFDKIGEEFSKLLEKGSGVVEFFKGLWTDISGFFKRLFNISDDAGTSTPFTERLAAFRESIQQFAEKVSPVVEWIVNLFKQLWDIVKPILDNIVTKFKEASLADIGKFLSGGGIAMAGFSVLSIRDVFTKVGEFIEGFNELVVSKTSSESIATIKDLGVAILLIAAALAILTLVDTEKLYSAVKAITIILLSLRMILSQINSTSKSTAKLGKKGGVLQKTSSGISEIGRAILEMGAAILLIAIAFKIFESVDPKKMGEITLLVIGLLSTMAGAAIVIGRFGKNGKAMAGGGAAILAMGAALIMVSLAFKLMENVDPEKMTQIALTLGGFLIAMAAAAAIMGRFAKSGRQMAAGGAAILIMSVALIAVATAIKIVSAIPDTTTALEAMLMLSGILIIMAALATGISNFAKSGRTMIAGAFAILVMSVGLNAVASAIAIVSSIKDINKAWQAFGMLAIILLEMGAIAVLMGKFSKSGAAAVGAGAGILMMAVGLNLIAFAVKSIAEIPDMKQAWSAVGMLAALLGVMAILFAVGGNFGGASAVAVAASVLIISAAMIVLATAIKLLGTMPFDQLKQGLIAIGIALAGLVAIGFVAQFAAVGLLAIAAVFLSFGASVALVGAGLYLAGAGVLKFAEGLALLAVSGPAAAKALVTMLDELANNSTAMFEDLHTLIVGLIVVIAESLTESLPQIVEMILTLLFAVLDALFADENITRLVDYLLEFVIQVLEGINENIEEIMELITEIAVNLIIGLIEGLTETIPDLMDAAAELIVSLIEGLADAIDEHAEDIVEAANHLIAAFIRALVLAFTGGKVDIYDAASGSADGTYEGFKDKLDSTVGQVWARIRSFFYKIKIKWNGFKEKVKEFGKNIVEGIKEGIEEAREGLYKVADTLTFGLLTRMNNDAQVKSPSRKTMWTGEMLGLGLARGMKNTTGRVYSMADELVEGTVDTIYNVADRLKGILDSDVDMNPTIRPVLDLTDFDTRKLDLTNHRLNLKAARISAQKITDVEANLAENQNETSDRVVYNQYNYSPKALSPIEIYRQTKNQLSLRTLPKGVVVKR